MGRLAGEEEEEHSYYFELGATASYDWLEYLPLQDEHLRTRCLSYARSMHTND